jgi:hypothetical protein
LRKSQIVMALRQAEHVLMRVEEHEVDGQSILPGHLRAGIVASRCNLNSAIDELSSVRKPALSIVARSSSGKRRLS